MPIQENMKKTVLLFVGLAFFTFKNQAQTVTDIDGNVYNTVTVGMQTWMRENLTTTKFRDGTDIPNVANTNSWRYLSTSAWCDYDNSTLNSAIYGKLYNWYAATDPHQICPLGWHVPTDADWNILAKYLDNSVDTTAIGWSGTDIGGKLKETGTMHWTRPPVTIVFSIGFTALPGGYRNLYGVFMYIENYGYWWSPKTGDTSNVWKRNLNYDNSRISRSSNNATYRTSGFCIRCIMDEVTTSVYENKAHVDIQIYPNPSTDKLFVSIGGEPDFRLQIYNMAGACVLQKEMNMGLNEIDIGLLTQGVYLIKMIGKDLTLNKKLIKE